MSTYDTKLATGAIYLIIGLIALIGGIALLFIVKPQLHFLLMHGQNPPLLTLQGRKDSSGYFIIKGYPGSFFQSDYHGGIDNQFSNARTFYLIIHKTPNTSNVPIAVINLDESYFGRLGYYIGANTADPKPEIKQGDEQEFKGLVGYWRLPESVAVLMREKGINPDAVPLVIEKVPPRWSATGLLGAVGVILLMAATGLLVKAYRHLRGNIL